MAAEDRWDSTVVIQTAPRNIDDGFGGTKLGTSVVIAAAYTCMIWTPKLWIRQKLRDEYDLPGDAVVKHVTGIYDSTIEAGQFLIDASDTYRIIAASPVRGRSDNVRTVLTIVLTNLDLS